MRTTNKVAAVAILGAALLAGASRADAGFFSGLTSLFKKKPVSGPLTVTPEAQAELADLVRGTWDRERGMLETALTTQIAAQSGQTHGKLTVEALTLRKLDVSRPPAVVCTPIDDGQKRFLGFVTGKPHYAGEQIALQIPGDAGGWTLELEGRIAYDLDVKLGPIKIKKTLRSDLAVTVSKVRVVETVDVDTTDPAAPTFKQVGRPTLDFDLKVRTHKLLVDALLVVLKPAVHAILQHEIKKAVGGLDPILAALKGQPGKPFGSGAPAAGAFGPTPDLEQAALMASEDVQNDHTPFGTVYEADFDAPTYRQGKVTGWSGMGDSPIWTGSYLTGEALRWQVTQDPRCVANAQKVIDGLRLLLDVQQPGGGRLSRYAVPMSHPFAQTLLPASGTRWIATLNGQQYVCEEDISRDQHTGAMMGLSAAYDFMADPKVRADSKELIQRVVDFLESTGWNALRRDGTVSAPFVQSSTMIIAFTAAAERTDPAKYGPMRARHGRIASFDWIGSFLGLLDPLEQYYKWNLGHTTYYTAMRLETDPDRYRHLERAFVMTRKAVGHHRNAWFDGVEAALDPAQRTRLAPTITDDLRRLVWRGRRDRPVQNSADPSIEQATYLGLTLGSSPLSFGGQTLPINKPPRIVAKYPVPVEKRPNSDFIWQRNPFDLDGGGDAHHQAPGVDVMLPYWLGRAGGFVK